MEICSLNSRALLSVVIPARNEAQLIQNQLTFTANTLTACGIPFELVVVDDHSTDNTVMEVEGASVGQGAVRCVENERDAGIGRAMEVGIRESRGDVIAIMMADGSDSPSDLVSYYRAIVNGADAAFGSRFTDGASVQGYPHGKLIVNRIGNRLAAVAFNCEYNDLTNAFKAYRKNLLKNLLPLRSKGFEVTLELPVRAIQSGASYQVMPISWRGRSSGQSKMRMLVDAWRYLYRLASLWSRRI